MEKQKEYNPNPLIVVKQEVKDILDKKKVVDCETYSSVVERLVVESNKYLAEVKKQLKEEVIVKPKG